MNAELPSTPGDDTAGSSGVDGARPAVRDHAADWQHHGGLPRRKLQGRLIAGVAAGLSARTGMSLTVIRLVFVITTFFGGFGAAVYVLAWLFMPAEGRDAAIISKARTDALGMTLAAGAASLLFLLLFVGSAVGVGWIGSLSWPPVVAAAGLVLVWRNAPEDEKAHLRGVVEPLVGGIAPATSRIGLRIVVAGILLAVGLVVLLTGHVNAQVLHPLFGTTLVIAAIAVLLGPWWLRMFRDLMQERQGRIRAEERADMASRVHDSVLQTLALIQRRADDPQHVVRLARAQERELRAWLFDGRAPGSMDGLAVSVAGGIRLIQQEVEAQHGVVVEVITVGDCPLDENLSALLAAAREATVNAAKWSGARVVSLFAEVEPDSVSVFVRDRGRGFDPGAVPADRRGIAESIHARLARRGGSATVKTAPGEGTEVSLMMPRTASQREPSRAT